MDSDNVIFFSYFVKMINPPYMRILKTLEAALENILQLGVKEGQTDEQNHWIVAKLSPGPNFCRAKFSQSLCNSDNQPFYWQVLELFKT